MCRIWHWVYNVVVVPIIYLAAFVGILVSQKLRHRATILRLQDKQLLRHKRTKQATIWYHAVSMGELEQIKPLIRLTRKRWPDAQIILTIYSPSAWRMHNDIEVDKMLMLPYDALGAMRTLIEAVKPLFVIVSRYDLWWNLSWSLARRHIPIVLVNATAPRTYRFRLLRSFFRCLYNRTALIIARTEHHRTQLQTLGIVSPIVTMPDSRIDQLTERMHSTPDEVPKYLSAQKIRIILGSTWNPDHKLWAETWTTLDTEMRSKVQIVIVPHEPTTKCNKQLSRYFPEAVFLSQIEQCQASFPVVIIDRVGVLALLYKHCSAAYVGGGFGAGVHSLLEPAVAGCPIACGPRIQRSDDAQELLTYGCLSIIRSAADARRWVREILENPKLQECAQRYRANLLANVGISTRLLDLIEHSLQLEISLLEAKG